MAPDILVAFGRPKGDRGFYLQWKEEGVAPQVVFEILSPGNTITEMFDKLHFYEQYGVEEYYQYDLDNNRLQGWLRQADLLRRVETIHGWQSPRLGIRFELTEFDLVLYDPKNQRFETYVELQQRADQEKQRADQEKQRADVLTRKLRELSNDLDKI